MHQYTQPKRHLTIPSLLNGSFFCSSQVAHGPNQEHLDPGSVSIPAPPLLLPSCLPPAAILNMTAGGRSRTAPTGQPVPTGGPLLCECQIDFQIHTRIVN